MPVAAFSLLAAIPAYIYVSIAAHTKPGNDYFSTTLFKAAARRTKRWQRGYSFGSSLCLMASRWKPMEEGTRVMYVSMPCLGFESASMPLVQQPSIHPDWLNVSCSLREGVWHHEAMEVAKAALRTLYKLIVTTFSHYKKHSVQAIKGFHKEDDNLDKRVNPCLNLTKWSSYEPATPSMLGAGPYPDDREWKDDIATVCEFRQEVLEQVLDESVDCQEHW
jgi:hypothetical protein